MSGYSEFGKCEICGEETYLQRTYFRYDIRCECHYPKHFEMIRHCEKCKPVEPRTTKIEISTELLKNISISTH